jgi:hypothetical protein
VSRVLPPLRLNQAFPGPYAFPPGLAFSGVGAESLRVRRAAEAATGRPDRCERPEGLCERPDAGLGAPLRRGVIAGGCRGGGFACCLGTVKQPDDPLSNGVTWSPLTVTARQDALERKVFVKRRPVQPEG